jgi:hypothetical protein
MLKKIIFPVLFAFSCTSAAEDIRLSETEMLHFDKGQSFQFSIAEDPDDGFEPSLKFSHFGNDGFVDFTFKVYSRKVLVQGSLDSVGVKNAVTKMCEKHIDGSVEKISTIQPVVGMEAGYYCTFTDASITDEMPLMPGMFKKMTLASFEAEDYVFWTNAFSNTTEDPLFGEFQSILRSFKISKQLAEPLTTQSR